MTKSGTASVVAAQRKARRPIDPGKPNLFERGIDYGNLHANLDFLRIVGVLTMEQRVLEVGSGNGSMLDHLRGQGFNVQGVDADSERIATGRELYGELPCTLVTSAELPFDDESFDLVISFDVFEHIAESDLHVAEVSRVLKPRGYYLLQTPNRWPNIAFEILRMRSLTAWREFHCSLHTRDQLIRRFERHGYEVEMVRVPVVTDFFLGKIRRFLGPMGVAIVKRWSPERWPWSITPALYCVARKR